MNEAKEHLERSNDFQSIFALNQSAKSVNDSNAFVFSLTNKDGQWMKNEN